MLGDDLDGDRGVLDVAVGGVEDGGDGVAGRRAVPHPQRGGVLHLDDVRAAPASRRCRGRPSPGRRTTAAGPGCGSPGSSGRRRPRWPSGRASRGARSRPRRGTRSPSARAPRPGPARRRRAAPAAPGRCRCSGSGSRRRAPRGCSPRRPDQPLAVGEGVREGLLQQHRDVAGQALAPPGRRGGGAACRRARRPAPTASSIAVRSAKPGQPAAGGGLGAAALVDVADADELDPTSAELRREDRVEVDRGDVAAADDGDPQRSGSRPHAQRAGSPGPSRRRPGGTRAAAATGRRPRSCSRRRSRRGTPRRTPPGRPGRAPARPRSGPAPSPSA